MGWARLLERVFGIDIEHCPQCGGDLKIIAAIEEPAVIVKILTHLGLPARAPQGGLSFSLWRGGVPVQTQTPLDKAFPTHLTVVSSMMNKKNVRHSPGYGGCARRS